MINSQFLQRMIAQRVPRGLLERLETDALKTRVVVQARLAAVLVSVTVLAAHRPRRWRHMRRGLFTAVLCAKRKIVFVPIETPSECGQRLTTLNHWEGGGCSLGHYLPVSFLTRTPPPPTSDDDSFRFLSAAPTFNRSVYSGSAISTSLTLGGI